MMSFLRAENGKRRRGFVSFTRTTTRMKMRFLVTFILGAAARLAGAEEVGHGAESGIQSAVDSAPPEPASFFPSPVGAAAVVVWIGAREPACCMMASTLV